MPLPMILSPFTAFALAVTTLPKRLVVPPPRSGALPDHAHLHEMRRTGGRGGLPIFSRQTPDFRLSREDTVVARL